MADDLIPTPIESGQVGSQAGGVRAPDYRQIQQPMEGLEPWRLQNSGAEARAAALEKTFKEFEGISAGIYKTVSTKAGTAAGAAAGMNPNFQPKTGLQAATAYGQAYDAAAHQTYMTQSQLSLEQHLSDIEKNNIGNPDGFQNSATAVVQAATKAMDPTYVPEMTNWAQSRIQAGVNRQQNQKAEDVRNTALATYQSATPDLITAALHTAAALPGPQGDAVIAKLVSDDKDRLDALVASRTITPEQSVTLHAKMADNAHNQMTGQRVDNSLQPVLATMRSNVEAADKLIVTPDPNLTPDENHARLLEFEKERQEYVQSQTRARVDDLNSIHQSLAAGNYGQGVESTIHSLYKQGALSEEGYFSATAESIRNQRTDIEDQAGLKLVDAAMHGEGPRLDPKDKATQEAVDKYFQAHVSLSGNVGDAQYAVGAAEVVRQTGIVPKSVQAQIRAGLLSGDPTLATRAAGLAEKIHGVNPDADVYVGSARLTALAGVLTTNMDAGIPAAKALAMAHAQVDVTPEQKKIRDQRYSQDLKTGNGNQAALQSALQAQDGGMFTHAPAAPVGMQASYESLVHQFYDQTGDIAKSRELAGDQLRKTWGVTTVNGAPEYQQYPIRDADVPAVRADIASSAKDAGYTGDASQIHLTPNAQTTASGGRIWSLTHVDANGSTDVLLDKNNRPLTYSVPSPQDFAKNKQAIANQKLDQARAERAADRANSIEQNKFEEQLANELLQGTPAQKRQAGR